jgi:hypothetical protein
MTGGTVGRTQFPIPPSGKASCLTSSKKKGRFFVDLKVEPGEPYPEDFPKLSGTEHREKFRRALANG